MAREPGASRCAVLVLLRWGGWRGRGGEAKAHWLEDMAAWPP